MAASGERDDYQQRKLRVCVLQCLYEDSTDNIESDLTLYDRAGKYEWSNASIRKATAVQQVQRLSRQGYDVFLNLCDGAYDEDSAGLEVVQALERFGCAYTGADARFYEPTKATMKKVAYYNDVKVPGFAFIVDVDQADDKAAAAQCSAAVEGLAWPLIVKHPNGYASIGMGRDSRVETVQQLVAQVRKFVCEFGGALVEEFIAGREFTVLVAESPGASGGGQPVVYCPVECIFGPGESFKHFDLKWKDYDSIRWQPLDAAAEPKLDAALREAAGSIFTALGGVSFGRSDFRVDEAGNVFFLEINPNCGIFYPPDAMGSADFILSLDQQHGGHVGFIDSIVAAALARAAAKRAAQTTEVCFRRGRGYGLYAARALASGEVVVRYEEQPRVLVSRGNVARHWPAGSQKARWFDSYAYPISEEVWALWSDDPEQWLPLNHSCDPNTWLVGLDLVARRPIAAGEQVTAEYATFCGPSMEPFDCACGAPGCRRRVSGADHLAAWLGDTYAGHISDWVAAARSRAARQSVRQHQQV